MVDWERRRPQRTETYIDLRAEDAERVFPEFVGKIAAIEKVDRESSLTVKSSHLDVNGHVNNVKYLEFVLDSFPLEWSQHSISDVTVNFINEARYGDEVVVRTAKQSDDELLHSLRRADGEELCRLQTRWT